MLREERIRADVAVAQRNLFCEVWPCKPRHDAQGSVVRAPRTCLAAAVPCLRCAGLAA